jgi:hypothetical protein
MLNTTLLATLLAAAPPAAPRIHVLHAALLVPGEDEARGGLSDVDVRLGPWLTATRVAMDHVGYAFELHAEMELMQERTFVELTVPSERVLAATGPWTVVLQRRKPAALVGGREGALELGFTAQDNLPVMAAELDLFQSATVPAAEGPANPCLVRAMHAAPDGKSPRWEPASYLWTIHRGAPVDATWHAAWAQGNGWTVHGFVNKADVACGVGSGGGFGLEGYGPVSSDGQVMARAALLPSGTRLFASPGARAPLAVLHKDAHALRSEAGWWLLASIREGRSELTLHHVWLAPGVEPRLEPLRSHGTGSTSIRHPEWPRRAQRS